jgi:putative ABC transport system substrate-binding protein
VRHYTTNQRNRAQAAPHALLAQPAKRVYRIAILDDAVEGAREETWRNFRNRIRELVLAEGNDVAYEARYARGNTERLPALAAELVALKPDIIVCPGSPPTIAAMKATSSIPIVFVGAADPVGTGLVASLARPESNVTGTSILSAEITGKLLELMHDLFPGATRLAYLIDPSNKASVSVFRRLEQRARAGPHRQRFRSRARTSGSNRAVCGPAQTSRGVSEARIRRRRRTSLVLGRHWTSLRSRR